MKNATKRLLSIIVGTSAAVSVTVASATLIGPIYPPAGGVTFSGSGSAGDPGGRTNTYSAIDESLFDALFFGAQDSNAVGAALDGVIDTASEVLDLNLSSLNVVNGVGSAEWDGQSTAATAFGPQLADIRFVMTITDTLGARPTLVNSASVAGMPTPGNFALVDVLQIPGLSGTNGDYLVNLSFQARNAGTTNAFQPINSYFNSLSTGFCAGGCVRTSFTGGFYEQVAAVPEPASLACLGLGLVALAFTRRGKGKGRDAAPGNTYAA